MRGDGHNDAGLIEKYPETVDLWMIYDLWHGLGK